MKLVNIPDNGKPKERKKISYNGSILLSQMLSSITRTHSSVRFRISCPQKWITVYPKNKSFLSFSQSRERFRSIFLTQYSGLFPFSSLGFKISQSFPWKNSLSQKMAILYFVKTMSGEPGRALKFFR